MNRPVVAVVTGFTKSAELAEISLAPLRVLKLDGLIDRILAVTWDSAELDSFVAPLAAMEDVELVRVPQPVLAPGRYQNGAIYQIRNLQAALALVPEDDALIFKTRPDFVAKEDFLADKIEGFERYCAPCEWEKTIGVEMPASPFARKVWLPWADSNQPFFYEDGAFMGLKQDVAQFATDECIAWLDSLGTEYCGWYVHIARFVTPFRNNYPIFEAYLRNFRYMLDEEGYRDATVSAMLGEVFFLHLLIAHAWILATSFHVDCGDGDDLLFFPNLFNLDADWSRLETLRNTPPYNNVEGWRRGAAPGRFVPCISRAYGRLMDDKWQHALFTAPALPDLGHDALCTALRNTMLYREGVLANEEQAFERRLAKVYANHWTGVRKRLK